ncbi:MAG TPA: cyclic nucleotide-binding domain-containing protein [Bryobacteraceae bacterium]|nr:cyclic nucleotide-binding domain-containing protein [Bryobacteraceae bacterium]
MRKALYVMGILDDQDVEWIASHGRRLNVRQDEVLIREGQPVDALFIVLEGSLRVRSGTKHVATLLSGEIVGEISFVDSRPPAASVTADQSTRVLAIPRDLLSAKMSTDPWFASRFFRALATFLADRLRTTTARLGYGDAPPNDAQDGDELAPDFMDSVSLASVRFDRLLKRLQVG